MPRWACFARQPISRGVLESQSHGREARRGPLRVTLESRSAAPKPRTGQDASPLDEERIKLWKERPVVELFDLAKLQAARAEQIGYGKTPLSKAGEKVRMLDRDQAAESIKLALTLGFKDLAKLRSQSGHRPPPPAGGRQTSARRTVRT